MTVYRWFSVILISALAGCGPAAQRLDRAEMKDTIVDKALNMARAGEVSEAVATYEKVLAKNPGMARVHLELGMLLHEAKQDYIGALYHYRKYLLLRPETDKLQMIKQRMKIALQALTVDEEDELDSSALNSKLRKANLELASRVMRLEAELAAARNSAQMSVVKEPDAVFSGVRSVGSYVVKRGDSLSGIALKVYNDAEKWGRIYEANRAVLEQSDELKVGQVLIIP